MGRFTRIPETNLPGTLGGIIGQAAGTVIGTANISLEKLQEKLNLILQRLSENRNVEFVELNQIEQSLDAIESSILKVEQSAESLNITITSVRSPITALKVAINIAKYLPLPAPVASVSVLQADIVQMLLELVAQIEQIILTLEVIIKVILELLEKLRKIIFDLRKILSILKTNLSLQKDLALSDKELLERAGILDILKQLTTVSTDRVSDIIWVGDYSEIDTGSLAVENQIKAAESGTTVEVYNGIPGTWNTYVYCISERQPKKPVSIDLVPTSWVPGHQITGKTNIWQTKGIVSGKLGKVVSWTIPQRCLKENIRNFSGLSRETGRKVNVFRYSRKKFNQTKFNLEEANAIILTGTEENYDFFLEVLQTIENLPVSPELKSRIQVEVNPQEDQSNLGNEVDWYGTTTGQVYTLRLRASSVSPKIATQRYVEVTDESGTVVYEGPRTFATKPQVLFEEVKVRLTQLLG